MPKSLRKKVAAAQVSPRNAEVVPEGQRRCPICAQAMQTIKRDEETIDLCPEHGIWLDRFEIERMFARRARSSGRRTARQVAAARRGRALDWFFWGMLIA